MRWCGLLLLLSLSACVSPRRAAPPRSPSSAPAAPAERIEIDGQRADAQALLERAVRADVVVLGEKHDNPEHHRLQARVLAGLIARGARPRLILEMVDEDMQPVLDRLAADSDAGDAERLPRYREELAWEARGWPSFDLYAPIFAIALAAKLPMVAGNVPRALLKRAAGLGEPLGADEEQALGLDHALPADAEAALRQELAEAHCGALPESALGPMARAQRARDFTLARHAAVAGGQPQGPRSVIIAGAGHAQNDRGVPYFVRTVHAPLTTFSVAFTERGSSDTAKPPFDARWWTSAANADVDHCASLRHKHPRGN